MGTTWAMLMILLLLVAAVCFLLVFLGVPVPRVSLLGLGLFCWVLTVLIPAWPG